MPPKTPPLPPQLLSCGEREFYRIDQRALQVFEVAEKIPPAHIRGSRVARQSAEFEIPEPLNVLALAKRQVLAIARDGVYRLELGKKQTERYAPIDTKAPLWAFAEGGESFVVRVLGEASLRHYDLARLAPDEAGTPSSEPRAPERVEKLTGFDSRSFGLLGESTPMYSTAEGLRFGVEEAARGPTLPESMSVLFGDASESRYWTADDGGRLKLWERANSEAPVATSDVPGVVIDAAREGARVAVLSLELDNNSYQPTVTVFIDGRQQARVRIGPTDSSAQPAFDLCLLPGRPWVVVGGRHWLQLLDWSAPRLLAEW